MPGVQRSRRSGTGAQGRQPLQADREPCSGHLASRLRWPRVDHEMENVHLAFPHWVKSLPELDETGRGGRPERTGFPETSQ